MIDKKNLEKILQEILPKCKISEFNKEWILKSSKVTEESIKKIYNFLKGKEVSKKIIERDPRTLSQNVEKAKEIYQFFYSIGTNNEKIETQIQLILRDINTLKRNYNAWKNLGIENKKLSENPFFIGVSAKTIKENEKFLLSRGFKKKTLISNLRLLSIKPEINKKNYNFLHKIVGVKKDKLETSHFLLSKSPETLKDNYYFLLEELELDAKKIASRINLVGRNKKETIKKYEGLIKMGYPKETIRRKLGLLERNIDTMKNVMRTLENLGYKKEKVISHAPHLLGKSSKSIRKNYQNHRRFLERKLLLKYVHLTGIPSKTIESNVQFLYNLEINYNNGFLLGSKLQTKRKKLVWMLREVFDYKNISEDHKKQTINRLYEFVRNNPQYLVESISSLEKNKEKLIGKVSRLYS